MASIDFETIKVIAHFLMRGWIPATLWDSTKKNEMFEIYGPYMGQLRNMQFKQGYSILGKMMIEKYSVEDIKAVIPQVTLAYAESRGISIQILRELFGLALAQYVAAEVGAEIELRETGMGTTVAQQYEASFVFITGWIKSLIDEETLRRIRLRILREHLSEKAATEVYKVIAEWSDKSIFYETIEVNFPIFRKVCKEVEVSLTRFADELGMKRRDLVLDLFRTAYVEIVMEMTGTS